MKIGSGCGILIYSAWQGLIPCESVTSLFIIWAATWENVSSDMCAQRSLKSAWAQSDQSLRYPHEENFASLTIQNAPSEDWRFWCDFYFHFTRSDIKCIAVFLFVCFCFCFVLFLFLFCFVFVFVFFFCFFVVVLFCICFFLSLSLSLNEQHCAEWGSFTLQTAWSYISKQNPRCLFKNFTPGYILQTEFLYANIMHCVNVLVYLGFLCPEMFYVLLAQFSFYGSVLLYNSGHSNSFT